MLITLTLLPSLRLQSASNMPFLQPHLTFNRCSVDQDLSQSLVRCIWQPRQGFIRFGTEGGLNQDNGYSFEHFQHDPQNPNSLSHNHILTINEDRAGMLWIGAWGGGLNRCDPATEQFTRHRHDPDDHQSLSANEVITIHLNRRGTLWVGTGTAGLNKFDHATGTLTHCREKDGLPNDVVCGIRADEHGNLWMSTNQGIAKFNSTTGQFRNYDGSDGLQSDEFKVGACFKGKGGETFSGGINGLNALHPPALRDNPPAPPVLITDFQLFNRSVALGYNADRRATLPKAITATDAIKLSDKDEVFFLGFVALNYASATKNQNEHKMEGFGADWIAAGTRRFATCANLDPGEYTFRVKGSNNDGNWNERGATIKIIFTLPAGKPGDSVSACPLRFCCSPSPDIAAAFITSICRMELESCLVLRTSSPAARRAPTCCAMSSRSLPRMRRC